MRRDRSLDFLRGTAIFFMIVTHAIGVFYNGDSYIIDRISWWGGTVCFTIFLFVFAAVYGLKLHKGRLNVKHELKRALFVFLAYYFIALWVFVFGEWRFGNLDVHFWTEVHAILRFEKLMYFTEFILAFGFYILIIVLLQKQLRIALKKPLIMLTGSLGLFLLGAYLYSLSWDAGSIGIIKAHLVGNGGIHSFPVLSYAPVIFTGLVWGYLIRDEHFKKYKWAWVGAGILVGTLVAFLLTGVIPDERFPPSLLFLNYGLAYCFAILALFPYIERVKPLEWPMFFMGKHAFSFYFLHILIMVPLGLWFEAASADVFRLVFLTTLVFLAISGFVTAKNRLVTH